MLRTRWMIAAIAAGWMGVAGAQGAGAGSGGGAGGSGAGAGKDTSSSAGSRTPGSADMQSGTGTGPRDSATPQKADEKAMGTGSSAGSTSSSTGAMGPSDTKSTGQAGSTEMTATLATLHAGNEAEVQAGKYMQQQATNGKVKDFAKKMVDDHTALDEDGQKYAQKHSLDLTTAPGYQAKSTESKSMLDELKSMQGAERDRHYMQMMVADHQKDVSEVKQAAQAAKQSGQDKEYTKLLGKAEKKMEGHLKDAQKISRDLGSRQARTPANQ